MKRYLLVKSGVVLPEEAVEDVYRKNSFTTFNEKDYEAWKQEKIEQGQIRVAYVGGV